MHLGAITAVAVAIALGGCGDNGEDVLAESFPDAGGCSERGGSEGTLDDVEATVFQCAAPSNTSPGGQIILGGNECYVVAGDSAFRASSCPPDDGAVVLQRTGADTVSLTQP